MRLSKQIFAQAGVSHDNELSLDEFIDWTKSEAPKKFFDAHSQMLKAEIAKFTADPNSHGSTNLSTFELAEEQLLSSSNGCIDLSQKYIGDEGLAYFIEDMRSHAKHLKSPESIKSLNLRGNGISSLGTEQLMTLLKDAAADRYGPLGAYLGKIQEIDLSGNARITNEVSPVILGTVNKCPHVTKMNLSGTKISRRMQDQISQVITENKVNLSPKGHGKGNDTRKPEPTAGASSIGKHQNAGVPKG